MSKWGSFQSGVLPANSIQQYVNFMFNNALTYLGCQLASKNPICNPWVDLTRITCGWHRKDPVLECLIHGLEWDAVLCFDAAQSDSEEIQHSVCNVEWVAQQAPAIWEGSMVCASKWSLCVRYFMSACCLCCLCGNLTTGEVTLSTWEALGWRTFMAEFQVTEHKLPAG